MLNWLHHLFNPHCEACELNKEADEICKACESKNAEIARLKEERDLLLNHIISPATQETRVNEGAEELKPIKPNFVPWHIRRRMLEENDRSKAKAMNEAAKPDKKIEELENELLRDPNIPTEVALGSD